MTITHTQFESDSDSPAAEQDDLRRLSSSRRRHRLASVEAILVKRALDRTRLVTLRSSARSRSSFRPRIVRILVDPALRKVVGSTGPTASERLALGFVAALHAEARRLRDESGVDLRLVVFVDAPVGGIVFREDGVMTVQGEAGVATLSDRQAPLLSKIAGAAAASDLVEEVFALKENADDITGAELAATRTVLETLSRMKKRSPQTRFVALRISRSLSATLNGLGELAASAHGFDSLTLFAPITT